MSFFQVLPQSPQARLAEKLGQSLGLGLSKRIGLNMAEQAAQQAQTDKDPVKLAFALARAGMAMPGQERLLAPISEHLLKLAKANQTQGINYTGDMTPVAGPGENLFPKEPSQQPNQFYPNTLGEQGETGNVPQPTIPEKPLPLMTPNQVWQEGERIARENTQRGNPMTVPEGVALAKSINEERRAFNKDIEAQKNIRVERQRDYGDRAENALSKFIPDATPEMKAILRREGEKASNENISEANIDYYVSNKARDLARIITNVEKDLSAPRTQNAILRGAQGNLKNLQESMNTARRIVKPLLDLGLYDTARNLLSKSDFYPEERETIINPMPDYVAAQINQIPEHNDKTETLFETVHHYSPEDREVLKNSMKDVFKKNPNISPILMRKVYEDKNYDWRVFEDVWNDLVLDGDIELSEDQRNQANAYLNRPPLGNLEKIFYDLKFIGR